MLKLRVITALVLIPLVILGIFYSSVFYFNLITAFIMLLAGWEWSRLSAYRSLEKRFLYLGIQALFMVLSLFMASSWVIKLDLLFWLALIIYLNYVRTKRRLSSISPFFVACLGWFIISSCWLSLKKLQVTPLYLIVMLLIVWSVDTAAYIGGRLCGRHLLAPTLSPRKTWEGLIIGLIFSFFIGFFLCLLLKGELFTFGKMGLVVLITSLTSVAGDLFESQLKRLQGLKDSGCLLPGHGGLLDRIDGLLGAAPAFTGTLLYLGLLT